MLKEDIETQRFWELYMNQVVNRGLRGSVSDFLVWMSENYPEMMEEGYFD